MVDDASTPKASTHKRWREFIQAELRNARHDVDPMSEKELKRRIFERRRSIRRRLLKGTT